MQDKPVTTSKRVAVLYEGGSLNVHPTADIEDARRMLCYDPTEDQRLVESKDTQTTNEAARIWADAVKQSGIWMEPCADKVAEFGRLIIPKMQEAINNAKN